MPGRTVVAIAATVLSVAVSAGCGGAAPAPAAKSASQASSDKPAQKAASSSSPAAPKPSPTADPAGRTEPVAGACPDSHQIKGATGATGERLYYEPGRQSYPSVTPEICFTAGGDARANGYRSFRD